MTFKEAEIILEKHNEWRRGSEIKMQNPRLIGIAIEKAIQALKERNKND